LKNYILCLLQEINFLSVSGDHDKTRRKALSDLYDETINYASNVIKDNDDPVIEELNKMFPNICERLDQERKKMLSDVAPVLVLGIFIILDTYFSLYNASSMGLLN
jgi:DNA repair exonuclease SbcCD nuclease subunit